MKVITSTPDIDFRIEQLSSRCSPTSVLMVTPNHFDVLYVINPHMKGNVGNIDKDLARQQWHHLKQCYEDLGFPVHIIQGQPNLPDMVFAANQSFPYVDNQNNKVVIISRMASQHRVPEVEFFAQ